MMGLRGLCLVLTFPALACRAPHEEEAAPADSGLDELILVIGEVDDPDVRLDLLKGTREGLRERGRVRAPKPWSEVYAGLSESPREDVREEATLLALLFGDRGAREALLARLLDPSAPLAKRRGALSALVDVRDPGLAEHLQRLLDGDALRRPALRALAGYDREDTPEVILRRYASWDTDEKRDAVSTLASRLSYARQLLSAVEAGRVPSRDISVALARHLGGFKDTGIDARLEKLWGVVRSSSEEKKASIARFKELLSPAVLEGADLSAGRRVYDHACSQCHKLYGIGGEVGPDLTGSDRRNLDYVLGNVIDPNAVVANAYRMTTLLTKRGRIISGIVQEENADRLTVQTVDEVLTVPAADIVRRELSELSIMPEGLFSQLKFRDVRDLVAYLRGSRQVAPSD